MSKPKAEPHGCKGCATCEAGFTKPTDPNVIKGSRCSKCGHVRCPGNPSPPAEADEPDNAAPETPHEKRVLTAGGHAT